MTKASDILRIKKLTFNDGHAFFSKYKTATLLSPDELQSLLNKWDSVEALKAENALYREYLQEITNRVNNGEILPDKLFVKIEQALKQTTKTK